MNETDIVKDTDSILGSIKKMLGLEINYTPFDKDVIIYINGVFMDLQQLGAGPVTGYSINDYTSSWIDFSNNVLLLNAIKPYVYLKVKLIFDPPTSSSVLTSFEKMIDKFEWRILIAVEEIKKEVGPNV